MKATRKKRPTLGPGYDGAEVYTVPVRVSLSRTETRVVRARPGTFEWRYNRADDALTPLYHAGVQYAVLMERAGAADGRSPAMEPSCGAGWNGLPDGRVAALDELRKIMKEIGSLSSSRLMTYCVRGKSVSEIASSYGVPARDMAAVLHMDLRGLAIQMRYLGARA